MLAKRSERAKGGRGLILMAASLLALAGCGGGQNSSVETTGSSSETAESSINTTSSSSEETIDMSKFPNYVEDLDTIEYNYDDKAMTDPYWWGNVIYNETVLLRTQADGTGLGHLRYKAMKVVSVRDYTLKTEYVEGVDYVIDGTEIKTLPGSKIKSLSDGQLRGSEALPEGFNLVGSISNTLTDCVNMGGSIYTESPFYYGTQVYVTYAYDVHDLAMDSLPSYQLDALPGLKAKLESGSGTLSIVGLGDSVLEGCSSSKNFDHEPYQPPYYDLFAEQIESRYGLDVTGYNCAVGGTTSGNGAEDTKINQALRYEPDLVLVHFGINDLGGQTSSSVYSDNIMNIILKIRASRPDCEFLLISPIGPNPWNYDYTKMERYVRELRNIAESEEGIALLDMFAFSQYYMSEGVDYYNITGNGINHPNDYGHRLYTGALLSTITKLD